MFIALYIAASLPYDFVLKDFTLSIFFSEHNVSSLCISEDKTNQLSKISGNWLFNNLLTNKQFSIKILFGSLIMLDSENRELAWSNLPLKCRALKTIFWIINTLLIELFVWPQTTEA